METPEISGVPLDGNRRAFSNRGWMLAWRPQTLVERDLRVLALRYQQPAPTVEHGVPLKKKELRSVFRQYNATGQHRKGGRYPTKV